MASKKKIINTDGERTPRTGAVAAFILSQPADMKATEVVEAGKAAGHSFGPAYVYTVRGRTKRGTTPRASSKKTDDGAKLSARAQRALEKLERRGVRRGTAVAVTSRASFGDTERQLAALIVQVGTERAEAILERVKEALSKLAL